MVKNGAEILKLCKLLDRESNLTDHAQMNKMILKLSALYGEEASLNYPLEEAHTLVQLPNNPISQKDAFFIFHHLRTLLISYNYEVQSRIRDVENLLSGWEKDNSPSPKLPFKAQFNLGVDAFTRYSLRELTFPNDINCHFVIGRTLRQELQESYQQARQNFFSPEVLYKAKNLSFFQGCLISPKSNPGYKNGAVIIAPSSANSWTK